MNFQTQHIRQLQIHVIRIIKFIYQNYSKSNSTSIIATVTAYLENRTNQSGHEWVGGLITGRSIYSWSHPCLITTGGEAQETCPR